MDQENQPSVDINLADADALTQLQGVGGRLAERIIEARPYENIDDLTRVRGISEKDVDRLRPFLSISETPEPSEVNEDVGIEETDVGIEETDVGIEETAEEADELLEGEVIVDSAEATDEAFTTITPIEDEAEEGLDEVDDEAEPVEEVAVVEVAEIIESEEDVPDELEPEEETPAPPVSQPAYVTRGGACGLIFLGGLVTLFLTVIITLGILSSFNNGRLTFASPYQIAVLETKVENMSAEAEILAADIDGLRTRMDNLEALSGQVSDMQAEFDDLQEEIVDLQAIVASNQEDYDLLVAQIEVINEDIDELTSQTDRFDSFLEGLRTLMESLFPETSEVEKTP